MVSNDPSLHDFRKEYLKKEAQMSGLKLPSNHLRADLAEKQNKDRFNFPEHYNEKDPNRVHSLR